MKTVRPKKVSPLPKDIKIVYEANIVGAAGRGETGVQTEQPAKTPYTPPACGGGAGDKSAQLGLREFVKKLVKIPF